MAEAVDQGSVRAAKDNTEKWAKDQRRRRQEAAEESQTEKRSLLVDVSGVRHFRWIH